MTMERDKLEIDRLANLVLGFGWNIVKQEFTEDKIKVEIERPRTDVAEVPEGSPG